LTETEVVSLRERGGGGQYKKIHIKEGSKSEKQFQLSEMKNIQDDSTLHETFP
jgi:hypothetical protein